MKKFLLVGAMLALTLALAACGGGSSSGGSSTSSGTASAEPFPELRWASTPVRRADVVTSFDGATQALVAPVAEGLMSFDAEGKVVPGVADSVDQTNPTTYVYHLKPGLKFSDGKPVTIEDVVYSLERNRGEDSQSAVNFENVASIKAQGEDSVVVKLKHADVTWINVPAYSGQIIEKAAAVKGGEDKLGTPSNLPIGSGPYKFASFSPDQGATLEVNPYWKGEKPAAQKVTVTFLKDDSALALAMRSGEVDGSFVGTKGLFEFPGVQLLSTAGAGQTTISLNTIQPPFDDIHVRKAIAYATDREGMVQAVIDGAGEVSETLTPYSLYGNIAPVDQVKEAFSTLPKYDFDLAAAKREMAKSKYPDGFTTTYQSEPGSVKIGQILAPDLAQIGIKLKIEQLTESGYLEKLYGPRDKIALMVDGFASTYPDPSSLMNAWLAPEQAKVNGLNSANWKNAEVGRLLEAQSKTSDGNKRLEMITQIFQLMKEDVAYIPLYTQEQFMAVSDDFVYEDFSFWTSHYAAWPLLVKKAS